MPPIQNVTAPVNVIDTGSPHDKGDNPEAGIALCLSGGGYRAMLAGALVFVLSQSAHAQSAISASGSGVVSPSVVVTSIVEFPSPGRARLQLLVLWRDAGWMTTQGRGQALTGGGSRGSGRPEEDLPLFIQASYGGVTLNLSFRAGAHKLTINDKEVQLGSEDNVVLVDHVDGSDGPHVRMTLHIDPDATPTITQGPSRAAIVPPQEFIRRSRELVEYLRCDVPFSHPNGAIQQSMIMMCQQFR